MTLPQGMLQASTTLLPMPRIGDPTEAAQAYIYRMPGGYKTSPTVVVVDGPAAVV